MLPADGSAFPFLELTNGDGFLGDPPPPPPAVQPRAIAQVAPPVQAQATTGTQLPSTGVEPTGMALMGFGLLMLGGLAFVESQRRETALMRRQARHLAGN